MNDKLKTKIVELCDGLSHDEMVSAMGLIRKEMQIHVGVWDKRTHFVCPITDRVISRKYGKKIMTKNKTTKDYKETSWYFMSRGAYNKIVKPVEG